MDHIEASQFVSVQLKVEEEKQFEHQASQFVSVQLEVEEEKQFEHQDIFIPTGEEAYKKDPLAINDEVLVNNPDDTVYKKDPLAVKDEVFVNNTGDTVYEKDPLAVKDEKPEFKFVKQAIEDTQEHTAQKPEFITVKQEIEDAQEHATQEFEFVLVNEDSDGEKQQHTLQDPISIEATTHPASPSNMETTLNSQMTRLVEPFQSTSSLKTCSEILRHNYEATEGKHPVETFTCDMCSGVFMSKYNITQHVFEHFDGLFPPSYICILCGEVLPSALSLGEHLILCQDNMNETAVSRCMCETTEGRQCDHYQKHSIHSGRLKRPETNENNLSQIQVTVNKCTYRCEICYKHLYRKSDLRHQKNTLFGEMTFKCDFCYKCFTSHRNLSRHNLKHTTLKLYECGVCHMYLHQRSDMHNHDCIPSKNGSFLCNVCGKCFSRKSHLTLHKNTHTEVKPYKCVICGKGFALSDQLKYHHNTHIQ